MIFLETHMFRLICVDRSLHPTGRIPWIILRFASQDTEVTKSLTGCSKAQKGFSMTYVIGPKLSAWYVIGPNLAAWGVIGHNWVVCDLPYSQHVVNHFPFSFLDFWISFVSRTKDIKDYRYSWHHFLVLFIVPQPLISCQNCTMTRRRYLTNIWVQVSYWGFETLTLFRAKILKTHKPHVPCLRQHPQFYYPV